MLESRQHTNRARTILVLLSIAIVVIILWQFKSFQDALARMPRGWTVAGAPVAGQKPQQIILKLGAAFSQTVTLHYRDQTLELAPQEVDFTLNQTATLQTMDSARAQVGSGSQGFLYYLSQRVPPPRDIPAVTTFSEEKLRAFLTGVSQLYDQPPTTAAPLVDELRFVPGQPGSELDISASVPPIEAALQSATHRDVKLVVKTVPPIPPKLQLLHDLLDAYVKRNFDGQAGLYIKDLTTGEETGINEEVAFSGLSLLKLPIMIETLRRTNSRPDGAALQLVMQTATGESGNAAANTLLQQLGDGDAYAGADRLNLSVRYLGLVNTFIATPYDQDVKPPAIVTRANSRQDINTNPDPQMQTTPEDMGILLEMLYYCSKGGGTLMVAYPNAFTPDACSLLLNYMSQATLTDPNGGAPMFIRAGLPAGTRVANKWGWDSETRANAAIIFTPDGDFVLVIFLRQPNWGNWQLASSYMADIARTSYNYFTLPK